MHVARLSISGVRGFYDDRSVDLDLVRPDGSLAGWTVLAGRNGSGKSTILQALALLFAGPRATAFIPNLADWISNPSTGAEMSATLRVSSMDTYQPTLFEPYVSMRFRRPSPNVPQSEELQEPEVSGTGVDSLARRRQTNTIASPAHGWFYAGYGPFRHLGTSGPWRRNGPPTSKRIRQISSLFDESVSLADAVDWLIEQHLYQLERRSGAAEFLQIAMKLLGDGLLPDGFRVCRVDSDGLWVKFQETEFPLREMSDGYRAVTALVVDILRQMRLSYGDLALTYTEDTPTLPYPGVVLIDEVDAHLHVSWQKLIGTWLKTHFPKVQFIVTTHSPYVCQSADPGGLIRLPGPGEHKPPHVIDQKLYERIVYGSGDDAVLSELFGVETPYSTAAEDLRRRLGDLEVKVLDGSASDQENSEYMRLSRALTSSLSTRVDEVAARLGREK